MLSVIPRAPMAVGDPPFDIFDTPELAPEGEVHFKLDREVGLRAIVAIHSTRLGPALGGCRLADYPNQHAALYDALRLARGMSYKAALAGLPYGGGKAVLLRPSRFVPDRAGYFERFGRFVDTLGGRYITAEDLGTGVEDMDAIARATPYVAGASRNGGDPSPFTALGVCRGIEAAVAQRLGCTDLAGLRVAIQGLGHVGHALAQELYRRGARLIVSDLDPQAAARCADEFQAQVVSPGEILGVDCEVFAPCALGGVIDDLALARLRAQVVAGSANNQLAEPRHGEALARRGILYAPDYVINAGGLIHVTLAHEGAMQDAILNKVGAIGDTLAELFQRADRAGLTPERVADALAEERLNAVGGKSP